MGSFIGLGVSTGVTWYLAMAYESTELMLLVYLQAALFVLAFFAVWYRKFTISVSITVPVEIAEPEKQCLVKLITKNKGFLPLMRMEVLLVTEDLCTGDRKKAWVKLADVPRGEGSFVRMVSFTGTGTYRLRPKRVRVYDFTGLFSAKKRGKSEARIQVMPRLHDIPVRLSQTVRNFYGEADIYDEHTPGHDNSELFAVREYRKGDRLQNIHWKLTAKQDDLMVKEHSLPKACPVVFFLGYRRKKRERKPERMLAYLEAVAGLSFSMMDAACPHYVVWYDETEQDIVRHRVDTEESFFMFLGILMGLHWREPKEDMKARYRVKYRMEPYVWALSLDETLVLKKEDETVAKLSVKELTKSLEQTELVL